MFSKVFAKIKQSYWLFGLERCQHSNWRSVTTVTIVTTVTTVTHLRFSCSVVNFGSWLTVFNTVVKLSSADPETGFEALTPSW